MVDQYSPDKHFCDSCLFHKKNNVNELRCRRFPPIMSSDRTSSQHPPVRSNDTCGEWKPENGSTYLNVFSNAQSGTI